MECGCIDPLIMEGKEQILFRNETFCPVLVTNPFRKCAEKALSNYAINGSSIDCPCRPECEEYQYQVSLS